MDFLELVTNRYSVRKFENTDIEKAKLAKILEAGRVAPTACNRQPQRILVLQSKENLEKLKKCTPFHFDAPIALLICVDIDKSWKRNYDNKDHGAIDASIVTTQMMLQAWELGIGSTWVCSFDPEAIKREFHLPQTYEPVNILPMGYPTEDAKPSKSHQTREKLENTVFFDKF